MIGVGRHGKCGELYLKETIFLRKYNTENDPKRRVSIARSFVAYCETLINDEGHLGTNDQVLIEQCKRRVEKYRNRAGLHPPVNGKNDTWERVTEFYNSI